jgi:hypothetical protein
MYIFIEVECTTKKKKKGGANWFGKVFKMDLGQDANGNINIPNDMNKMFGGKLKDVMWK